jgi:hypothetical protein
MPVPYALLLNSQSARALPPGAGTLADYGRGADAAAITDLHEAAITTWCDAPSRAGRAVSRIA